MPDIYLPQVQLSLEVFDLEVCHFVQFRPYQGPLDPGELCVTVVHRDRSWFQDNLPKFQKFASDLRNFRHQFNEFAENLLPEKKVELKPPKKRALDAFLIGTESELLSNPVTRQDALVIPE